MKVLIDLCVESDSFMFKNLIERLQKNGHDVLVTSRKKEAIEVHNSIGVGNRPVGEYAYSREDKLLASSLRIHSMTKLILKKWGGVDAVVSNTGIEACRVGFGLGAKVHTFHDHPEAFHQMMLTIPLSNYVYAPWTIERSVYRELGLSMEGLVLYKGFLVMSWLPNVQVDENVVSKVGLDPDRPVVVFRQSELGASYLSGAKDITLAAIKKLAKDTPHVQFVTRPRYYSSKLEDYFKGLDNVTIFQETVDLQSLLAKANLLIGGGATMCLESAYFGTPVISCRQISSPITRWLESVGLSSEAKNTEDILHYFMQMIGSRQDDLAKSAFKDLEFPNDKLYKNIVGETD